ncbi:hypothetical protein NBRC110019_28440 [Neptunitalea chrysea]|uniref:Uncharacterized protein n=1 Tax=Neptunitalea chrysea TaxID=1647581 RepID=A0A9W6B9G6_9FLAO|nr:hypothetical protein [Neptunitalea chrysea]GLB53803.1 hypothetical protein NBRC110019_28440 [Neptunitalea chrysea]
MIKKEFFIGFLVGVIANVMGVLLYCLVVYSMYHTGVEETLLRARAQGSLSKIIALGAVLNIAAFFGFLKVRREYRARGVIFSVIFIAIATFFEQFIF